MVVHFDVAPDWRIACSCRDLKLFVLLACRKFLCAQNNRVTRRASILFSLFIASFSAFGQMTSNEVATVMAQALTRANDLLIQGVTTNGIVAVVDREGFVVGVWSLVPSPSPLDVIDAI